MKRSLVCSQSGLCGRFLRHVHHAVYGEEETLQRVGFQQIIYGAELEAFQRVVAVGGGEDDLGWIGQCFQDIRAEQAWHVYIEKNEVDVCFRRMLNAAIAWWHSPAISSMGIAAM